MSLLSLIQDAAILVGIDEPSEVASSSDSELKQLRVISQQEGDELSRAFDWRRLKVQAQIVGDGSNEYWDLPDDFDRQQAGDNLWLADSPHLPLVGPISDESMLALKASTSQPSRSNWRYFGDQVQIWPILASGEVVNLEYRTTHWISSADGTTVRSRWVLDTDYALVPERLMTLGVVWRWKAYKGLDYAQSFQTYQTERMKAMRADGGFRTLRAATRFNNDILDGRKNLYRITP
jgi:hypothetical protein